MAFFARPLVRLFYEAIHGLGGGQHLVVLSQPLQDTFDLIDPCLCIDMLYSVTNLSV